MNPLLDRRLFLSTMATSVLGARLVADEKARRKFTMDLVCGMIGVRVPLAEAIDLAAAHGFESVAPDAVALQKMSSDERKALSAKLKDKKLVWGASSLPVDFRNDQKNFDEGLKTLPDAAKALQEAGATRVGTWIKPSHDKLTYLANLKQHGARLREVAKILGDNGLRFGLEYVGPKTSWTASKYSFVHTLAEMLELLAEIKSENVGLVLDSWHWYTAGETVEDLAKLTNKDVVACDLNDAPKGIERDKQMDLSRELPATTGVIDVKAFLGALVKMDYDGPVRAEPFNAALNKMPKDDALKATAAAMKKAFAIVDG